MIKILLSDDHTIIRNGLRSLLSSEEGMAVVAEANDGVEAVTLAKEQKPDVVIMDVSMPKMNGIEATRQIVNECPGIKVIGLSMYQDRQFIVEMMKAGASGYVLKDSAFDELVLAINTVCQDKNYLSGDLAGFVIDDLIKQETTLKLSERENEILKLIAEGHSTKEISSKIFISVKTVETHRRNIMKKLDTNSVADLTRIALRKGLISL